MTMDPRAPNKPEMPALLNREQAILEFNRRVLAQARRADVPLLERLRYVCIVSSNLDEFFEVRIADLVEAAKRPGLPTSARDLDAIAVEAHALIDAQYRVFNDVVMPLLAHEGIVVLSHAERNPAQQRWVGRFFETQVRPLLVPVGLDPSHPFPQVANKSLNFIARLGGKREIQRAHVGDTGCASAMVALQQAGNHVSAFPGHRALVVSVELCSCAYTLDDRLESAVAHAIFADGAGALALSADGAGPALVAHRTIYRSEHLSAMGFEYPGGRPRVVLSKDVRRIGATMMGEMARALMDTQGLKKADVRYWVLHSAGRRVLDRARDLLELSDVQMAHARDVLREFGNMSSATILFVLERTLQRESPVDGEWGVMIGLGPGFAAEGALLRW